MHDRKVFFAPPFSLLRERFRSQRGVFFFFFHHHNHHHHLHFFISFSTFPSRLSLRFRMESLTHEDKDEEEDDSPPLPSSIPDQCPICLNKLSSSTATILNPCYHVFCFDCILTWSKLKLFCPLCKSPLTTCLNFNSLTRTWSSKVSRVESSQMSQEN